jgi:hypothetical protein
MEQERVDEQSASRAVGADDGPEPGAGRPAKRLLARRGVIKGAAVAAGAGAALYVKPGLRPLEVPVAQAFSF